MLYQYAIFDISKTRYFSAFFSLQETNVSTEGQMPVEIVIAQFE